MALQKPNLLVPIARLPVNEAVYCRLRDHLMRDSSWAFDRLHTANPAPALSRL